MNFFLPLCRSVLVLALLALSIAPDVYTNGMPTQATRQPATTPLETLLNADDTLNLSTGFNGSLNISGWRMALAADGTPHFSRARDGENTNNASVLGPASLSDDVYWNGRFDFPPGVGVTPVVQVLAVSGNDLYVGGSFTTTGSLSASYIARWNQMNGWSALGNGVNNTVDALVVSGSTVYAGGNFTQICGNPTCNIGNTNVNHIAAWNGSNWSSLGNGVSSFVNALAVSGSMIYVGGGFTEVCGNAACNGGNSIVNDIAAWNGSNWSALGNGVNDFVYALAVSDGTIYVGGGFSQICDLTACNSGNMPANHIAIWNGSSWSTPGNGVNTTVDALVVSGSTVYVGGNFTLVCGNLACNSGNTTVNHVAMWNGSSWSALGSGINSAVFALDANGPDLYVGGDFATAGGKSSINFAHWNKTIFVYLPLIEK